MKIAYLKTIFISLILIVYLCPFNSAALAQFKEVKISLEANRLQGQDREDLNQLVTSIHNYFTEYQWIDDPYGMELSINLHLSAESVDKTGFERIYSARMFISNAALDMKFFDKSCAFVYGTNQPLFHQEMYQSLTSLLDFWAYMMIGHEMDTYDILGGTSAYERARSIANMAQRERGASGWKDRIQILDEIISNRPYREMKSDYYYALYLMEEGKYKQAIKTFSDALDKLEKVFSVNSHEKWTSMFMDAHAREWMSALVTLQSQDLKNRLLALDPYREKLYKEVLNNYKPE